MPRPHYEITSDDVGKPMLKIFGKVRMTSDWIGRIMPQDVGKRVYLVGDVFQVKNEEQFRARLPS